MEAMGIQLQGKIRATSQSERAVAALEGLRSPDRKTEKKVFAQELEIVLRRGKGCGHWGDDRLFLKIEWMDYPVINWKSWC